MPQQDNTHETHEWIEYRRLILSELERLDKAVTELQNKISALKSDVLALQIKATLWGSVGGMLPAIISILYQIFKS